MVEAEPQAMAVQEAAGGAVWTRASLASAAEALPRCHGPAVVSGKGVPFLAAVLRGFRDGVPLLLQDLPGPLPAPLRDLPVGTGVVKTTSGSTGQRRYVLCSAAQLAADAASICSTMKLRREWPNIAVISMSHSYGFSNLVLPLLLHGVPLIHVSSPLPGAMAQALALTDRCVLPAVPAMWRAWQNAGLPTARIALAISAGAALPLALESAVYENSGLKIHNFYGSSECGGIAYDASDVPRTDPACAGKPMDGVQLSVNENGHLQVRSKAVAMGYLEPDPSLSGGLFQSTDMADLREGQVFLTGRTGDTINSAGRKIAPGIIEEALQGIPGIQHCVVFGVPSIDPLRGEEIIACLRLFPGFRLQEVREQASGRLPAGHVPRSWRECPDLEPDARGKISRVFWRERWVKEER